MKLWYLVVGNSKWFCYSVFWFISCILSVEGILIKEKFKDKHFLDNKVTTKFIKTIYHVAMYIHSKTVKLRWFTIKVVKVYRRIWSIHILPYQACTVAKKFCWGFFWRKCGPFPTAAIQPTTVKEQLMSLYFMVCA